MALKVNRLTNTAPGELRIPAARDEEEEKLSGLERLNAAKEKIKEESKEPEKPEAPEQQISGMERLQAAKKKAAEREAAPQISNTYREVDKEKGRIRTRSADLSTPSWQDDPEEMAAELNRLGATLDDTGSKLTAMSSQRAMANSAVQNIGNEIKAYETKLGMLSDTMANSTDAGERQRAQQESKALDLYYQKAKLAQERYTARANELNSQFDALAGQYESALQKYQEVEPKYTRRLGLGDSKAAEYEKQAEELRRQADSLYRSGQANYTLVRQAEQAEANAQKERQNYAQYLYSTEGEDKAMKYATGVEKGNRRKEEAASFGQKVLNTVAGAGANWFSNYGGSPLILMAELMGMHDEAEALRANDQFSSTAQELKRNAGKVGGMLIDTAGAAGHMMSTAAFGGMAANALANTGLMTTLTGIAESSPLVTSSAARAGAKLATGLMGEFIGNAGNAAISLSSGVNGFNEARENGASYDRALANGISKGVLEYLSNKLSAGMPFENSAEQKGLMNQAVEYLAGKLGASEVLKKFGGTIVGKAVGKAWDIFGEGLEEVVTGIGDPIIDYLTYDKTADWRPKIDKLVEDFEGGVLLSLLMTGGEATLGPTIEKSAIVDQLVSQGIDKQTAKAWAAPLYQETKAMERIQKAIEKALGSAPAAQAAENQAPAGVQAPAEAAAPRTVLQQMADKLSAGQQLSGQDARKILADPEAKQTLIDAGLITGREINDSAGRTKVAQAAEQYIQQAEQQNAPPVPVQAEARTETQAQTATANAETPPVPRGVQTPTEQQNAPQATETPGSKTIQKALATARQKAADKAESLQNYGFTTAGAEATARVQNEQSWDAEEKAVAQALRDAGYEPTFTVGLIENAEGDSVPYLVEGNKIAIRADGRQSIQTLAEQAVGQTLNIDQSARTQAMADINKARETAKAETPKAETPKVSARYQAAVDSAKAAGASEGAGALAGRLAEALGRDIVFYNEDGPNGNLVNGYTADGKIYINAGADRRTVAWVVGHELTHNVENSKVYNALKNLAKQAAKAEGQNWNDRIQQRVDSSARVAEKLQNPSVKVDTDGAERELVADFFADRLLTNEDAIRAVCEYETSAAKRIRNYIQNLLRKLGGKEPTLEWALDRYNKALKDVAKKAQAEAEKKLQLKSTQTAPKSSVESVQKYSLNVQTIDYAVNYTADNEQTQTQLKLLKKDITRLADIQNQINKEMGGRSAKNIHDLNDYLQSHPKVWQELWDMQEALEDEGIRCDFVTEPGSPNIIDDSQVPGGLKGLPIEYVASDTGKRYKFTAFWRNMPQMLLDSMSHDSRERLRTAIMQGVEDAYARKTGETDLLPYFKDQFPTAKEIEKVAGARTIKNIRNQTEDRVQAPIRDAEKTVAALNLNSACPMFTIGNNGCYLDACYLTQMANGATGTNLFRSAWYTGELLQISDADIQRMNELGGLRVNGVGDTTLDNKSQLKDALRHAGMRGLKVKMITKQRASLEVLAEMYNSGTDISHVTVQPSMDNLWIPAELDDVYGAGVRGNTQLAKTVKAGRNEAAATGYEEMFGRATKVVDGVLYRKYGFTPEQIREMKQDFPFVQITPRYVVCTAQEIAEIALNRNGDYVNGGKVIQTLMHGKVPAGCVSDYPGDIINFGGARHVVERKDGKWHFYGEFIGKGGQVGKIIDGPNTPYGKVQRYVEQNYTKAEQDKIWLTLKNQMCCQANDFKDACAGCQSLCARGCAAFSSEDFDYRKYSLKDKAQAMEMDEATPTEGLRLKAEPEAKQESGLRLGGRQYSVDDAENAIQWSVEEDPETLDMLNSQPTVTVYRAMQLVDGKLYPPMAAKVKDESGKAQWVDPTELNTWYRSDERPDLIDAKGKFRLNKGNGGTPVDAAYNPYFHTSNMMLNDQFSSAWDRDNLVVVEASIPQSELTSGYRAQGAKDPVGEMNWHSGPVASKLKGDKARRVTLSRWVKITRVVPNTEVAKSIAKLLDGENISIPENTVTPSLKAELEKLGVQISPATGNAAKKKAQFSAEDSDDEYRQTPETPALEKLGIRLAASKGRYHLAEQLLERDKAAKALMRATKKAEQKLKATKAEKEFAAGIAAGIYEERDIPSTMDKKKVTALADYYAAEDSFKENMLAEVRSRINTELQDEAEDLLGEVENFKKISMLSLNERTPDRTFRAMFGAEKGREIFDWLIRPEQMNEAEKTRWHQKQLDRVRKFEDSKGKTRALTREESELTMLVMEGKAAAAAVADMEKKGLDAKGIRNAAENIRNGSDPADAAWEFGLKDKEREIAKNYARWMDTQDKLKDADSKIIETAAETYSQIFDEFYDAINDFLVAHGYEPIGYIKGYAPHMQPEETQNLLEKAFDKMGIDLGNDKAQGLPASIAGETAFFKPNKRWDPYFLHRTGTTAEYDIEKAYQSYVGYLSDILYHTDDIMRVRNFEKMIRKTYAPEDISMTLDQIRDLRNAPTEDRLSVLRDAGKVGKTTQLSAQEINEKLDEWEEEQYNALRENKQYNNLVMWLSNYANILAGKQSFADRGWEYSLGRNSLNFANRLQAAFQRSLVAGSLSSALNQTAQLPMIKTELGDRWYYAALKDILTGQTKGFWQDSDFLTTKHGVDMLTTDNYDKFINALFTPSNLVDSLVSTAAVRGKFLKEVHAGKSYSEAMRAADDFGRAVMGSREKGTRPLAYESKGLFSRMIHMFQVEAANSWDHIASDLPYEIKEIAKTQGKGKAARTLAALIIKGLLSAFLLNRATEEIYGGTPAPFDVIGLAMNFVASGKGMTTNQYFKTIIDNGLEKLGKDRLLGTKDTETDWDTGAAIEETVYNIMNDVPLARNVAGVLGLGDQTVPLPGAGGEFTDVGTAVKDLIGEGADAQTIENLIRASVKLGAQFAPAGRQITKTAEGIEAAVKGGSYSKKGKLQYSIDTPADKARSVLFGKNSTEAAREHWASGEGTMTEKQTDLVSTMRGWGMSGAEARKVINDIGSFEADPDPDNPGKTINGSKKAKVVDYIDGLKNLTSKQKDQLYLAQGYAESGLDDTPWHKSGGGSGKGKTYAPADLRWLERAPGQETTGLKLPSAPQARPTRSGLKLKSAPEAQPDRSGLKLR